MRIDIGPFFVLHVLSRHFDGASSVFIPSSHFLAAPVGYILAFRGCNNVRIFKG